MQGELRVFVFTEAANVVVFQVRSAAFAMVFQSEWHEVQFPSGTRISDTRPRCSRWHSAQLGMSSASCCAVAPRDRRCKPDR